MSRNGQESQLAICDLLSCRSANVVLWPLAARDCPSECLTCVSLGSSPRRLNRGPEPSSTIPMARLWRGYIRLLRDYTLPTQMASGATLMSTGDAISQHVVERKPLAAHDWGRTTRFAYYSVRRDWLKLADGLWRSASTRSPTNGTICSTESSCLARGPRSPPESPSTWLSSRPRLWASFSSTMRVDRSVL